MDWANCDISFGTFGHVRCEPGWSLDENFSRRLQDYDLWYVWDGVGRMTVEDRRIDLHAGVCVWMRPGRRYLAEHDPKHPLGVTFVHFDLRDSAGQPCPESNLPADVFQVRDPRFFGAVAREIIRLLRLRGAEQPGPAQWLFRSLIHDLLDTDSATGAGAGAQYRSRIEGQIARIYEQPGRAPAVRSLAREASLSSDHYTRLFKQVCGQAPRELIQQARLERSCQMLRESALSITEIADECGYADVFQFSRMFKRAMGASPSHWRR